MEECWQTIDHSTVGPSQISRPGAPGRGDVRQHVTSSFWMRCGCAWACQHGLPCVESTTTPKKANKGVLEGHSRLTRPAWWSLAEQVGSQIGIWDREAWWSRVEKHGGVTPINLCHRPDRGFCPLGRGNAFNALDWWLMI
ncbi:unnamed protein product [Prunus armeniaca]